MTLREALKLLGVAYWISVETAWKTLRSPVEFAQVAAMLVGRSNVRATAMADIDVAEVLGAEPVGLEREDDIPRLEAAFRAIFEAGPDPEQRFQRLTMTEPLNAARKAQVEAMKAHGIEGWTRDIGPGACALCREWAEEREVFPTELELRQHPNCDCLARPVTKEMAK